MYIIRHKEYDIAKLSEVLCLQLKIHNVVLCLIAGFYTGNYLKKFASLMCFSILRYRSNIAV